VGNAVSIASILVTLASIIVTVALGSAGIGTLRITLNVSSARSKVHVNQSVLVPGVAQPVERASSQRSRAPRRSSANSNGGENDEFWLYGFGAVILVGSYLVIRNEVFLSSVSLIGISLIAPTISVIQTLRLGFGRLVPAVRLGSTVVVLAEMIWIWMCSPGFSDHLEFEGRSVGESVGLLFSDGSKPFAGASAELVALLLGVSTAIGIAVATWAWWMRPVALSGDLSKFGAFVYKRIAPRAWWSDTQRVATVVALPVAIALVALSPRLLP